MKEDEKKRTILTNKSLIENQPIPAEVDKEKKDIQFLYQLTGQNLKISNLKRNIGRFLELTDYIFNDIKLISNFGKNVKNMEYNSKLKINNQSLYNNKVKCFNNNINLFRKKLNFIQEKNNSFKKIFEFITEIKNYGFYLDENFFIRENDMILDLEQVLIHHIWIINFQNLINIKNKNFRIVNGQEGNYKLKSDFYDYYNNQYVLSFNLEIKINNGQSIFISNEFFEKYIDKFIVKYFEKYCRDKTILNKKKEISKDNKELIIFYIKYLLYKFFKEEINSFRKYQKKELKEEQFLNKGLIFIVQKNLNQLNLKCNYFDNLEINFSISKIEKQEYKILSSYFLNNKRIPFLFNDSKDFYDKYYKNISNVVIIFIMEYIRIFLNNILFEIKFSKNITNYIEHVKKNNNLNLENIIRNSIFVKNITNIGLIILKNEFSKFVMHKTNFITAFYLDIYNTPLGKYKMFFEFYEKDLKIFYNIELIFDDNLNLTIIIKEPNKNIILSLDKARTIYVQKGRINFNYLYDVLQNVFTNFNYNNIVKYTFRNNIL